MKKIILIRHASAEMKGIGESDLARPLTPAGKESFQQTAHQITKLLGAKYMVYVSPALRATETMDILVSTASLDRDYILKRKEIYTGPADRILWVIQATASDTDTVILIGHNPLISQAAALLGAPGMDFSTGMALTLTYDDVLAWREIIHYEGNVHSVLQ